MQNINQKQNIFITHRFLPLSFFMKKIVTRFAVSLEPQAMKDYKYIGRRVKAIKFTIRKQLHVLRLPDYQDE